MAQLVEHNLAKVGVAGSSPVVRSKRNSPTTTVAGLFFVPIAWARTREGASVKQTRSVCSELARTLAGGRSRCGSAKRIRGRPVVRSKRSSPTTTVAGLFRTRRLGSNPRGSERLGRGCGVVCRECPLWAYHRGHLAKPRCKGGAPHGYRKVLFALMDVRCRDLSNLPALV